MRLPTLYLDVWTVEDLFDFLDAYTQADGETEERMDTAEDLERF